MAALPRAECPRCGRPVPVRRNGAFREHLADPTYRIKCKGSGEQSDQRDERDQR